MSTETKITFCRICESLCGLEMDVEEGRITAIRPDNAHVATRGFACPKGLKQHHLYYNDDRLTMPMKRVVDRHEPISWDQALSEIGAKVREIHDRDGGDALAMYVGTAAGFGTLHPAFAQGFMTGLGSKSMYSSATQDCANKFAAARHIYGFPFTQPFPDVRRTKCLIIVGANPVVSKWSFLQVPNPALELKQIRERGGKVIVVDPRRNETAKVADQHLFIRPGSDVFFFLSFLAEVIALGGAKKGQGELAKGLDEVSALAREWPAERTEAVTGVQPDDLRSLVATYLAADGAALYSSTGVNMGGNGSLAFWLQEVINAVTGNLDRAGGTLVGEGIFDFASFAVKNGILMANETSRVGGLPKVNDAFPGGTLADEILTPGEGQVRALFVTGGNPLITMPNAGRLRDAFQELELLVALDIQMSETATEAHYVLPCTSPLERPDLPFIFPLMLGLQRKPYLQGTEAIVPPPGQARDESTIYVDLARAAGLPIFGAGKAQRIFGLMQRLYRPFHRKTYAALPEKLILSLLLRITKNGSMRKLLRRPHGVLRDDHRPGSFLGGRVQHPDGKLDLAPDALMKQAQGLEGSFAELQPKDGTLHLITKRHVKTHNSWTHNFEGFVAGAGRDTNHLYMHPTDAESRQLKNGDMVEVSTKTGRLRLPLAILDDLMPGTVAMPHGWGHQKAKGMSVASATKGVNVNILAADGTDALEATSGMARLTGIPVEVIRSHEDQQATWSGM